ncbi:ATPase, T2SS/T4P/T4SS family [Embleya sp. NBC_00896]|uniref:CpaF family protein n=1 Tax=Embleya sp. NBC_00896 TaxID=2975961 RepID=UPI002F9149B9|nr:ATPase, T2SS/T4P/T4SS family [Embleya sp. NBC_00896]
MSTPEDPAHLPWAGYEQTPGSDEQAYAAALRERIGPRMTAYAQSLEDAGRPPQTVAEREETVRRLLASELATDTSARLQAGRAPLDELAEARVTRLVVDGLFGLGGLERLLQNPEIENINCNGYDHVFVTYAGGRKERVEPFVGSDEELVELLRTVAARSGAEERRIDRTQPSLNLQLPDGSRLFALMFLTPRVSVSIRRHRFPKVTLDVLEGLGVFDRDLKELLGALVRARMNILVAGGTNTGKTTLLRGLVSEIPPHERLITIEDTFELGLERDEKAHPDVVAMQAREANLEGVGEVDQAELVRKGLRMAPDRVIVGEIRGSEVVPACNAMSQGNDGSLSTIHASTSAEVFVKLAAYAAQSPERLSMEATNLLVAAAVDVVVHVGWSTDNRRVVTSVREIVGADGPQVVSNEVYRPGPDMRAVPATPVRAETAARLARVGWQPGNGGYPGAGWGGHQ